MEDLLIVEILEAIGFGNTAHFAGVRLLQYDLFTKHASVKLYLFDVDGNGDRLAEAFLDFSIQLNETETAGWGTDDLTLVDIVLAKKGFTRLVTP